MTKDSRLSITAEEMAKYVAVSVTIAYQSLGIPVPISKMMELKEGALNDIIKMNSIKNSIENYDREIGKFN